MSTRWQVSTLPPDDPAGNEFIRMGAWLNRMARVWDIDGVVSGTPPTATTGGFLFIPGTHPGTTDGSGNLAVTFPTAFPSGFVVVLCNYATSSESVTGFTANTGAATTSVNVKYLAVGY